MFFVSPVYAVADQILIRRAHAAASSAHAGQLRASGEPYLAHPEAVAEILMQLPAKAEVVAAGLLHDVLEDTPLTFAELEKEFGFEIAKLVNAVSKSKKLDKTKKDDPNEKRRALHRQFLDTIKDIRSAVIKLADRLHNMRTIGHLPAAKQYENAEETLRLYVPLARQIGLATIERELAALCLEVLPKWDFQAGVLASHIYESEIIEKGYHQNKLDLCLLG